MYYKQGTQCAYCGSDEKITVEHVIPQCLFSGALPTKQSETAVKVPACEKCASVKSRLDGDFRDALVIDNDARLHPQAQQLVWGTPLERRSGKGGKVIRALQRNQAPVVSKMLNQNILTPRILSNGQNAGYFMQAKVKVEPELEFIFKGLYYNEFGERLPVDMKPQAIGRLDAPSQNIIVDTYHRHNMYRAQLNDNSVSQPRSVGDVAEWIMVRHEDVALCIISFYGGIWYAMKAERLSVASLLQASTLST